MSSSPVFQKMALTRESASRWFRRQTKGEMSLRGNSFHQHEMFEEIISVICIRVEPRDMREKKDQSLIPGIIPRGLSHVKRDQKEL